MEFYSALKGNELLSHEKIWRKHKSLFPSERTQSDMASVWFLLHYHSEKGKTVETKHRSAVKRCRKREWVSKAIGILSAETILCAMLQWWIHAIIHLFRPMNIQFLGDLDDKESVFNTCVLIIKYSHLPSFSSIYFFTHETDTNIECLLCASSQGYSNEKNTRDPVSWSFHFGWAERRSARKMMSIGGWSWKAWWRDDV